MTSSQPLFLVLGGASKVGRRVVRQLSEGGHAVRAGSRSQTDTVFDWNDRGTYKPSLEGVDRLLVILPAYSAPFTEHVGDLLDAAAAGGVQHVTYLSARGIEHAPPEVALRAGELVLEGQSAMSYSILRSAWFMQNFSESFLLPGIRDQDAIAAPAGEGAEAFIEADDIAAAAVATLTHPERHAGRAYEITGPDAVTFSQAAEVIGDAVGRQIAYIDVEPEQWLTGAVASGVPQGHADLIGGLFEVIRSGAGRHTTTSVQDVIGREPVSFRSFAEQSKHLWIPSTP